MEIWKNKCLKIEKELQISQNFNKSMSVEKCESLEKEIQTLRKELKKTMELHQVLLLAIKHFGKAKKINQKNHKHFCDIFGCVFETLQNTK